jgi:uncharacterized protein (DUF1800 family)
MITETKPSGPGQPWRPYAPSQDAPWDLRRVVHLHRRAGFAATWKELRRDLADGPEASVDRLLSGKARGEGVPAEFGEMAGKLAEAARETERLKAWWFYSMLFGPDPLTERLALMWHNHFATSAAKVRRPEAMRRQNELFRRHARAPFGELLGALVRDPALLEWLDAPSNRKGHPNENLARELTELFTLGIGNYTERDVKEAARTLTGWTVVGGEFRADPSAHDPGEKTVLGRKGRWQADDLVRMLLDHPATSRRLAWRLCEWLMGEGGVDAAAVGALADGLREHRLDIGWAVGTVLRSEAFFAGRNLGARVLGPVEYVVGPARALEMFEAPPGTLLLADWAARLGQDLFYPPNVGGWPGGRHWISTRALVLRANYAAALVEGALSRGGEPVDALGLARRHGHGRDLEAVIAFLGELLLGAAPGPGLWDCLRAALGAGAAATPENVRRAVILILASPEGQLG